MVVAQYLSITIGGEAKPLPPRPEFRMELGTSSVPAMDRALIGAKVGDERIASFTFPADYSQADFAGKDSEYQLKILEVHELKLPALDDELSKKFGFDTLALFRERIREDLAKQSLTKAKEEAYEEAMRRLMETNPFDIPKARIANYVRYKLEQQGHVHANDDHGHDHSDLEQEAVFNIRRYRLLEEISKKEKIKPTSEEVDARLKEMAEQYGTDFETLKASLRKSGKILDVREELKSEKTLDFVIGFKRKKPSRRNAGDSVSGDARNSRATASAESIQSGVALWRTRGRAVRLHRLLKGNPSRPRTKGWLLSYATGKMGYVYYD